MELWKTWCACVDALRPACTRTATFAWMRVVLLGLCVRSDLAGITSFVRALGLQPARYVRMLALLHSDALRLDRLTARWVQLCTVRFAPLQIGDALVCLADGLKVPKEGRKMPGVKKLHQQSTNNSKPAFIDGHSFQAVSLLVRAADGEVASVPLTARIHEGVIDCARELRRTLLDRLVELFLELVAPLSQRVILVADGYYASAKVILPLLAQGHHLVTRVRRNAVAYQRPAGRRRRGRGRPRRYGRKLRLCNRLARGSGFTRAPSPVYGEKNVPISYRCEDLLWRPVGRLVRFVFVRHPQRGEVILLSTDTSLDPLCVIRLYGYRFKIEAGFRQAIHAIGTYAYHLWMAKMTRRKRGRGNQDIRKRSRSYKDAVRRKIAADHRFVQLGCIAQGLLQLLALEHRPTVWTRFRSWLRTMNPNQLPSEAVVAQALRTSLSEFLASSAAPRDFAKFIEKIRDPEILRAYDRAA